MSKLLVVLSLLLLPGAPPASGVTVSGNDVFRMDGGQPVNGGTLRVTTLPVRSLDPHQETGDTTAWLITLTYNTLLRMNQTMDAVEGDLAESWHQLDALTWKFRLRPGIRFQNVAPVNGRLLTSADVRYSLERMMGLHGRRAEFRHSHLFNGHLAAIETPDERTVILKTYKPYAPLLAYLATGWSAIVPREVVEKYGNLQHVAVGTGPFILREHVRGSHLFLEKNPDFFRKGLPRLDRIEMRSSGSLATNLSAYLAGKFHTMGLAPLMKRTISEEMPDTKIAVQPGTHIWTLRMPPVLPGKIPARKPWNDVRVRRAVSLAIDKATLLQLAWGGHGDVQHSPLPVAMEPWALTGVRHRHDPGAARRLLTEAGYPDGFATELMTWNAPHMVKPAQVIQDMLGKAGIRVRLRVLEYAQYYNRAYRHRYDLSLHIINAFVDPGSVLVQNFGPPDQAVTYHWPNKEIQSLTMQQNEILDPVKRRDMIHDIQRRIREDVPMVFLYTQTRFRAIRPDLHMKVYHNTLQKFQAEEWWIDPPGLRAH